MYVTPAKIATITVAVAITHCIHLPGCRYSVLCQSDEASRTSAEPFAVLGNGGLMTMWEFGMTPSIVV
jgi:hypothetical protein